MRRASVPAVRGLLLSLVIGLAGCSPDTTNTAFQCDASHGCPTGQSCVAGRCRRGGVTGEVECGVETCTGAQMCCVDSINPPRCIEAGMDCVGIGALCDGLEDCQAGDACCAGDTQACGVDCETTACLDDDDCPSTEPHCCTTDTPFWECRVSC